MDERLTRRNLLVRGAALAGAAALPAACGGKSSSPSPTPNGAAAAGRMTAYRLDPVDAKCKRTKSGGRCACGACYAHSRNKLFPTPEAADHNRAHRGCNCRIVAQRLPAGQWVALFGSPHALEVHVVDRRSKKVAAVFGPAA